MKLRAFVLLLASVLACALTARLGLWQLDRAAQKQTLHDQATQRRQQPQLAMAELAPEASMANTQHQRLIALQGQWLTAHTVLLDNRAMNGHAGFIVVTPLLLAPGDAVLVQRGWLPRQAQDRTRAAPGALPGAVTVQVNGRVAAWPSRLMDFGDAGSGAIRQNLDLQGFAREVGASLRPLSIQQIEPSGAGDGLLRDWPFPGLDIAKHHGYAFQWFALSALVGGLYAWFQIIRPRFPRRPR